MNSATENNLLKTIAFIDQLNALKMIERNTYLNQSGRRENSAEHSWHIALAAITLQPFADNEVDIHRVIQMLLVHDIGEICVGDTSIYADGYDDLDKNLERDAAKRVFDTLPDPFATDFLNLWDEFEACISSEAIYANSIDRFVPPLINLATNGEGWKRGKVPYEAVQKRVLPPVKKSSHIMGNWLEDTLKEADERGFYHK